MKFPNAESQGTVYKFGKKYLFDLFIGVNNLIRYVFREYGSGVGIKAPPVPESRNGIGMAEDLGGIVDVVPELEPHLWGLIIYTAVF